MKSTFTRHAIKRWFKEPKVSYGIFWCMLGLTAAVVTSVLLIKVPTQPVVHAEHYTIRDAVAVEGITFSVQGFRTSTGEGPLKPLAGNVFLIPTISMTNNTGKNFELIPLVYFYIKDRQGHVYDIAAAPLHTDQLTGPILPGETVIEEIGFEVPSAIDHPALYYERGTPDHPVVAVDLEVVQ